MEDPTTDQSNRLKEKLLVSHKQKGGLRTLPFIIANEALEKVANLGLTPDMILYLMGNYGLSLSMGTQIIYMWSTTTYIMPLIGAFLADFYFGRFPVIAFGCVANFLGILLLWLTAMIPEVGPVPCNASIQTCESSTTYQLIVLCSSFIFMSIGTGGIRSASLAFGADQLRNKEDPQNISISIEKYFSWYYQLGLAGCILAFSCVVYVQEHYGWKLGFGLPAALMFLSALSFFLASPTYVKLKAEKGALSGLAQVVAVSFRNRHLELPSEAVDGSYHYKLGSHLTAPSDKLRFLNKACIIKNTGEDCTSDREVSEPCRICTVDQVEELKAMLKLVPMFSTSFILYVTFSQTSVIVLQTSTMDRHITPNFEVPAGSLAMFTVVFSIIWLALYNNVILPLASKITGRQVSLSIKKRMGLGLVCSSLSMAVSAIVESIRRKSAIQKGFEDNPRAVVDISVWWLLPRFVLSGAAEAFAGIGQIEFFYKEFPKSMSSIASVLSSVGLAVGTLLTSFIFGTIDNITSKGGKESWVSSNINKGHLDYYYWVLSIMALINFFYYMLCCKAYGPCIDDVSNEVRDEEECRKD